MAEKSSFSSTDFERLTNSIAWSDRRLAFQKEKRVDNVRQFIGYHHTEDSARKRVPLPFIKMAVSIYLRQLAARAPRAFITAEDRSLRPTAKNFELSINQIPKEVNLQQTLRDAALEAMFGIGVVKCGLHRIGKLLNHDYGQLFLDLITLDNLILDMSAQRWDQIQYIGNRYWTDWNELKEADWIEDGKLTELSADEYTLIGDQGEARAEDIQINATATLYRDKIQLCDVFLPNEQLLITYAAKAKKLLKVIRWTGPASGPYLKLGFDEVPGNLMPIAPVNVWRDIHDIANILLRKLSKQADSQKNVSAFKGGDEEAVQNFKDAQDGDGITAQLEPRMLSVPGPDATTLGLFLQVKELGSWVAGNIDALGGLGAQSETLGQDRLLAESASAQLKDMSAKVVDFSKKIFETFAYYDWNDPVKRRRITKQVPGSSLGVELFWKKGMKKGKLKDYLIDIDVHSMQDNSPAVKMQKLVMFIQTIITPLMPAIQAQGAQLDVQTIIRQAAEFSDFPEGKDLVVFENEENDPKGSGSGGHERTMPANTTRTNERISRSGTSRQGNDQALAKMLMGGGDQNGNSSN